MINDQNVDVQSDEAKYRKLKVLLNKLSVSADVDSVIRAHVAFADIYDGLSHEYKMQRGADISQLLGTYKKYVLLNAFLEVRKNTSSVKEFCKASANAKGLIDYFYIVEPSFCPADVGPNRALVNGCLKAAVGQAATVVIEGISKQLGMAIEHRDNSYGKYGCFYTALNDLRCVLQLVDGLGYRNQENRGAENALRTLMHEALTKEKLKIANHLTNQISSGSGARNLEPLLNIFSSWNTMVYLIRECEDLIRTVNASDESQIPSDCLHKLSSCLLSAFKHKVYEYESETITAGIHNINRVLETFFQTLPNNGDDLEDKKYLAGTLGSLLTVANECASNIGPLRRAWLKCVDPRLPKWAQEPRYNSALLHYIQ